MVSSEEEDTPCTKTSEINVRTCAKKRNNISKSTVGQVDDSLHCSTVNEQVLENIDNAVLKKDIRFANYQQTEEQKLFVSVQDVHGESKTNTDENFIENMSEEETEDFEDKNSAVYIAKHVENIDNLNFDDSDVSIDDSDNDEFN